MIVDSYLVDSTCRQLKSCKSCIDLDKTGALCTDEKQIGLFYTYPRSIPINVMFIAESPPKPGNGFFYDEQTKSPRFRNRLFELIGRAGLGQVTSLQEFTDKGFYLADAINCRWDKDKKRDLSITIFRNCSVFLKNQIGLFRPRFLVVMGNKAKQALAFSDIKNTIKELRMPETNIIKMSFPLRAVNETDEKRIKKLKRLTELTGNRGRP
jgi:hypothetical protein